MKNKPTSLVLASALIIIVLCRPQCKKNVDELSKLPPITQEGKNTFGCLVNGKAWLPENGEIIIATPALRFYYDNINGGEFSIIAKKRIVNANIDQEIILAVNNISTIRNYTFPFNNNNMGIKFNNYKSNVSCITLFSADSDVQIIGHISISRFDLAEGVISGTFEFNLSKLGCETIKVTNGRFDSKL